MKIKVVTPELRFPIKIWIPYTLLSVATSKSLLKLLTKKLDDKNLEFMRQLDSKTLKKVVSSLKEFKGTELVNVKDKDGTEVKITL